ncbi:MAG: ribonuclease HIII [Erysipelotrichaceae bacterium]
MNTYSVKLDENTIKQIVNDFKQFAVKPNNPYLAYSFKLDDVTINIYTSQTVVFQGKNSLSYYQKYHQIQPIFVHGGSDEVGTGDFFGPICVCAVALNEKSISLLQTEKITDSKQLTDSCIVETVEKIADKIDYSLLILDNQTYNQQIKIHNMNEIKALMHNKAYLNLQKKLAKLPDLLVVDDFCGEKNYYNYLRNEKEVIRNITFKTKAESQYPAVALASMIARYSFIKQMEQLSAKYHTTIPKGAASCVDDFALTFYSQYGLDELKKVCKTNFKNYQKLIERI